MFLYCNEVTVLNCTVHPLGCFTIRSAAAYIALKSLKKGECRKHTLFYVAKTVFLFVM